MNNLFLNLLICSAMSIQVQTETNQDVQDSRFKLKRNFLLTQIYMHNGWVLAHRSPELPQTYGLDTGMLLLPPERAVPSLLGQHKERTFSHAELSAQRERLTRWIEFLATSFGDRQEITRPPGSTVGSGKPVSRVELHHDPNQGMPITKLPIASVGLHFWRSKPGSSLQQDFLDQSDAYARLRGLSESLYSDYEVMDKKLGDELDKSTPKREFEERARRYRTSKEAVAWLLKVRRDLSAIDRECSSIGFPVPTAWDIRRVVDEIREVSQFTEGEDWLKRLGPAPLARLADSLLNLSAHCRDAGDLCAALSKAHAEPPDGLDDLTLDLAWSSIVPLSDPNPERLLTRLQQAFAWTEGLGLKGHLEAIRLRAELPAEIRIALTTTGSLDKYLVSHNNKSPTSPASLNSLPSILFYKFTSVLGATPASLSLILDDVEYHWKRGGITGTILPRPPSAMASSGLTKADLAKISQRFNFATNDVDGFASTLTTNVRDSLVKYLTTFQGTVTVVHDEPNYLLLRVNNAKGLILRTENFWEDVDINLITSASSQGTKLVCIVDGRWSTGIFAPRSTESFRDMEPQYSKNMSDFAGQLLVRIRDDLLKHNDDKRRK
jgi:hypothetical protein